MPLEGICLSSAEQRHLARRRPVAFVRLALLFVRSQHCCLAPRTLCLPQNKTFDSNDRGTGLPTTCFAMSQSSSRRGYRYRVVEYVDDPPVSVRTTRHRRFTAVREREFTITTFSRPAPSASSVRELSEAGTSSPSNTRQPLNDWAIPIYQALRCSFFGSPCGPETGLHSSVPGGVYPGIK
jgi:hypothetical protein